MGLIVDTISMCFTIPDHKIDRVKKAAKELLARPSCKVKVLASFVGLLQSLRLATGPIVSIFCRHCYNTISEARFWSSYVKIRAEASFELRWWINNIDSVSSYHMNPSSSGRLVSSSTASDASEIGFCTYEVNSGIKLATRSFTDQEKRQSSTFRELLAIRDTWCLEENLEKFKGLRVRHMTDNQAVTYIMKSGSKKLHLHKLATEIVLACRKFNVRLEVEWLGRNEKEIQVWEI